jgi:DNA-binding CsgD family transcriptional regulator
VAGFLQRAVELSQDPTHRADRALAAAGANFQAGAFDAALRLLAVAEAGPLDTVQQATVALLRGNIAFASGHIGDAPALLLNAAKRLEPIDVERARQTYLTAWGAAFVSSGHLAETSIFPDIRKAVQALPPREGGVAAMDLLLDGLVRLSTEGHAAATPTLQEARIGLVALTLEDVLDWGWMATAASNAVWDNEGAREIAARQVQLVRDAGALSQLPLHLAALGLALTWTGDFAGAESLMAEGDGVAEAIGSPAVPWTALRLRGLQGSEGEAIAVINSAMEQARAGGGQAFATYAQWAAAVLFNGLARYDDALASAKLATSDTFEYWVSVWALPELIEAATRVGADDVAREALGRLTATTQPVANDPALGIEARSRALVTGGSDAEDPYREAIDRLTRTPLRPELARAHLLFGEWLRREGRRIDAREQLRIAYETCTEIGMMAFAERARRELKATGEKVRKRDPQTADELTPQEEQIARLAREGFSNPEIGAQLFISARTVEWHLRKIFPKLGITSRKQLRTALRDGALQRH